MNESRLEKLNVKLAEMTKYENLLHKKGIRYIAGVDEVGRGCLAGPVVAASVVFPETISILGIDDSKKLSAKKRAELYEIIIEEAIAYDVAFVDNNVIDEINILNATKRAMILSIESLDNKLNQKEGRHIEHVLIDAVRIDALNVSSDSIVKGDEMCISIAAASILAKVTRDNYMVEIHKEYDGYAFEKNKGYGTKEHYEGITKYGITPIHRRSFLKEYK